MESTFIPTANYEKHYENGLKRFLARVDVSEKNRELVSTYLREAGLGRTVRGRAKTRIGVARRRSYLNTLETMIDFLKKDLDQVTLQDMQLFIEALEAGRIRSRKRFVSGTGYFKSGAPLSARYIVDIKMNVRRYYKYLLGNCSAYPPLVDWIDVSHSQKEIQALTENEVQRLVDRAVCTRDRALIQVLFDGGFRLGELLNVRLHNVSFKEVDKGQRCFFLRAPYSKTIPRTVVLPMAESSKWLGHWLDEHPAKVTVNADGTLEAEDLGAQLFPMTATSIHTIFARLGPAVIGKHIWPHLMRHTSATYWANKLGYFKFCKRFGWTMTSDMPQRYIDAAGIDEVDTARVYLESSAEEKTTRDEAKRRLMEALRSAVDSAT